MATIAELRQQAATIKNATQVGENTANRVGTTFETVADLLDEEGGGGTGNLAFVDINDIDDIGDVSDMLAENPNIYTVTKTTGNTTTKVGTLIVFVNTNRYVLMQVLVSGYILNADGTLDTGGSDFTAKILWRGKWFNGTPPAGTNIGEWSPWSSLSGGGGSVDAYTKNETDALLARKQNVLTFDNTPTSGSTNPVTSGGVKTALDAKQATISDLSAIRGGAAAGATAYQKPAGGIPKTDLAADVQTSLGKADTALQEHQSLVNYYTKSEVNSLIVPQGVNAIPVAALPASGAANTLYFVQGTDSFTINAWDGTAWVTLATIAGTYDAGGALS